MRRSGQCKNFSGRIGLSLAKRINLTEMRNTRGRGGYSHTLPIRVCAAQRGRGFEAPDLERGIHFRGVFLIKWEIKKNCGSRLYLLLKIVADYAEAFI